MEPIKTFNNILSSFKIRGICADSNIIDNYEYYDVCLLPGTQLKDLLKYSNEISLALKMPGKPNHKILHEEGLVRLEWVKPRKNQLDLLDNIDKIKAQKPLQCWLGKTIVGEDLIFDIAQAPHTLVAGTTGSGKTTLLHNIIANLMINSTANIHLVDPKTIDFCQYESMSERISIKYSYEDVILLLEDLNRLMEDRYKWIKKGFNPKSINEEILIIDEFADLILQDQESKFHNLVCKLAQKSRAAKIHVILATQRPSVNVVSGVIKANFPARIACRVASHVDSKVVIDSIGAESLLGKGDAYIRDSSRNMERFQIAYSSPEEIVKFLLQ